MLNVAQLHHFTEKSPYHSAPHKEVDVLGSLFGAGEKKLGPFFVIFSIMSC